MAQVTEHIANPKSKSLSAGVAKLLEQNADDVVITLAFRSPLTKALKGDLKDAALEDLLHTSFESVVARCGFDPGLIEDICVGSVLSPKPLWRVRMAALSAGIPESVPCQVVNRLCASGLMAVNTISTQIKAGQIDIGLAIGAESISFNPDPDAPEVSDQVLTTQPARDASMRMGWTSEMVANDFAISRESMDRISALSFQRAEAAQSSHVFDSEIIPYEVPHKVKNDDNPSLSDKKTQVGFKVIARKDDGIRKGTKYEHLAKLRPAFPEYGDKTTGGNASQVMDGAAAVLMMTRKRAMELGVPILGKHVTTAVTGVSPRVMGIAPAYVIPKVLEKVQITQDDVDLFEINEAWASMYVYVTEKLGLDMDKVNIHGGAIALGHPLGARQIVTGLNALRRRGGRILVTSLCIGTGMGAAGVFVREN